jgi:thioredoxin
MKRVFFVISIALLGAISCNSGDGNKTINSAKIEKASSKSADQPIHLTKQTFLEKVMDYEKNTTEWKYKGELPAIVDFYADWCRPCKITSPILDELAKEYVGKIQVYKINIDEERELASVFGVQSIPTFLFIPMIGNPTMSAGIAQTPEQTKEMFKKQIEEILLKK